MTAKIGERTLRLVAEERRKIDTEHLRPRFSLVGTDWVFGAEMRRAPLRTGRIVAAIWVALASTLPFVQHCHAGGDEPHSYFDDADPSDSAASYWHAHLLLGSLELQVPVEPQDLGAKRTTLVAFEAKAPDAPSYAECSQPVDLASPDLPAILYAAAFGSGTAVVSTLPFPAFRATRPLVLRL